MIRSSCIYLLLWPLFSLAQGSFDGAVGTPGCMAIHRDSNLIMSWASECVVQRGYKDIAHTSLGKVNHGEARNGIGKSDRKVVSLGDGGVATFSFHGIVHNGPGPDFAVYENAFDGTFLELAVVEVSSNGRDFIRFPPVSQTPTNTQVPSFGTLDPTHLHNLAGKYEVLWGTPFDLEELKDSSDLNLDSIKFIRVRDVVGVLDHTLGTKDSKGSLINDPYPTDFQDNGSYTGGFDVDALGLINYQGEVFLSVTEPSQSIIRAKVFPVPVIDQLTIEGAAGMDYQLITTSGHILEEGQFHSPVESLNFHHPKGVYLLRLFGDMGVSSHRIKK